MTADIFNHGGEEWSETEIHLAFHDDATAVGYAQELRDDGFSLKEAIGLAEVASGMETEVVGMQFIAALLRKNAPRP